MSPVDLPARGGMRTRFGLLLVAVVSLVIAMTGASGAQAAPGRDIRAVQANVRNLEMRAAAANEDFKGAQAKLQRARVQTSRIKARIQRENDHFATLSQSTDALARSAYISGGLEYSLQALLADDPSEFITQTSLLDSVARSQAAGIRRTQTARLTLAQKEAELVDQERIATGIRDEMDAAKAELDSRLASAQAVLDSLQSADRDLLTALDVQQAQQSRLAADQAVQDLTSNAGSDSASEAGTVGSRALAAVQYALSRVGAPYSYDAHPPTSWDCSKLTAAAWAQGGVGLTALSYAQWDQVRRIPDSELRAGDLVFYFGGDAHHVALYIGNGKMVSASNPSDGVEVIDYKGPWYAEHYSGAGRVV